MLLDARLRGHDRKNSPTAQIIRIAVLTKQDYQKLGRHLTGPPKDDYPEHFNFGS